MLNAHVAMVVAVNLTLHLLCARGPCNQLASLYLSNSVLKRSFDGSGDEETCARIMYNVDDITGEPHLAATAQHTMSQRQSDPNSFVQYLRTHVLSIIKQWWQQFSKT